MAGSGKSCNPKYVGQEQCLARVIQDIRQGAARQHVDAVLIYEVFGKGETNNNPLAITKLAIIGYWLPTEKPTPGSPSRRFEGAFSASLWIPVRRLGIGGRHLRRVADKHLVLGYARGADRQNSFAQSSGFAVKLIGRF